MQRFIAIICGAASIVAFGQIAPPGGKKLRAPACRPRRIPVNPTF